MLATITIKPPCFFQLFQQQLNPYAPHLRLGIMNSTTSYVPNGIYAALTRTDVPGTFHWMIYLCITPKGGYKFHATTKANTLP